MFLFTTVLAEETAETTHVSWLTQTFEKFAEFPLWGWLLLAALLAGGVILWRKAHGNRKIVWTTKMLSMGAICMALSCVLSMIRLFRMPSGGSITPACMLPLMLFSYVYGAGPGITLGFVYGVMDFCVGSGYFLSVPQFLIDYPVAYAMCGLAGLFRQPKNTRLGLTLGVIVSTFGRYLSAVLAGVIFWSDLTEGASAAIIYSLGYNGSYMLVECLICIVLAATLGQRLVHELRKAA